MLLELPRRAPGAPTAPPSFSSTRSSERRAPARRLGRRERLARREVRAARGSRCTRSPTTGIPWPHCGRSGQLPRTSRCARRYPRAQFEIVTKRSMERRAADDEPDRERRYQRRARSARGSTLTVQCTALCSARNTREDPRGGHVRRVDLARREQHERERVEDHRDLEQVLRGCRTDSPPRAAEQLREAGCQGVSTTLRSRAHG